MAERAQGSASGDAGWRPPRPLPITPPEQVAGFRFAPVADGFDEHDRPRPWASRPWIEDDEERDRLLRYLQSGALLVPSDERTYDVFDPANPALRWAVPVQYLTDGVWIWSTISTYQLEHRRLAPQPAFLDHIVEQGYRCPPVPEDVRLAAREALFESGRIEKRLRAEYEQRQSRESTPATLVRGELSNEPPTIPFDADRFDEIDVHHPRFQRDVEAALLAAGWLPGRDAAARVDPWLAEFAAQTDGRGQRHEPFPAARDLYREFGLLDLVPYGRGEQVGAFPIHFFPADVRLVEVSAFRLASRLGIRTFPVGRTGDEGSILIVDEQGRLYLSHPAEEFFLGTSIEPALEVLVRGLRADTLASRLDDLRSGRLPGRNRDADG
ncbi:SUKH-3 domain-containing protein [Actinocatenispora thailandica]|uniref:SUKH-3 domain-containing protein n=1 Tax=Actinocatenispora thailandica TaxID=227318 RepID=UPI0031D5E460